MSKIHDFKLVDSVSIKRVLSHLDWRSLFQNYLDVDDLYQPFCGIMHDLIRRFVSFKGVIGARKYPPYIINLLEQRFRIYHLTFAKDARYLEN